MKLILHELVNLQNDGQILFLINTLALLFATVLLTDVCFILFAAILLSGGVHYLLLYYCQVVYTICCYTIVRWCTLFAAMLLHRHLLFKTCCYAIAQVFVVYYLLLYY